MIDFLRIVQDQVVNLAPMGVAEGAPSAIYPRLEGWIAACDLYNIPQHSRAGLVEMARVLFDGVNDRMIVSGIHRIPESDLREVEEGEIDG